MADINWGNTRAPMHPTQAAAGHGRPFHAQRGLGHQGSVQQAAMHPSHYASAQQAQHASPVGQQVHQTMAPENGAPPSYAHHGQHGCAPFQGEQAGEAIPAAASGHSRFAPLVNYAGAALSLALVVGLGVWGYQLAMRDVTGIPVVRALEGPMRIQPEEPGGFAAAHQGLAVNSVQAEGEASTPSDRVALAPAPETLDEEDLPADASTLSANSQVAEPVLQPIEVAVKTPVKADLDIENLPTDPVAAALAIAAEISRNAQPLTGETDAEVIHTAAQSTVSTPPPASVGPKVISTSIPGVSSSLRPVIRPADLKMIVPVKASLTTPVTETAKEVAPDAIPAGTRLVQLGAYDSAEVARAEWEKLSSRFDDYLPSKTRVIQKAQSGGKTFYRLRAMGFKDLADARRFCSALMAGRAACIPVVTR